MRNTSTIHMGYEVGTGQAVAIPARHLAITGQTQEAGKTTTLEALLERSGLRAVTFITKPGEASFTNARRVQPYFREQTDWQFVASILEASRGEKLKFERAWIIRASKGARTLADVHNNVRTALQRKGTGKDADVYTVLDAYLEVVVPLIGSVKWAPGVDLAPGVNVVDLGELALEMQHLVIRSTLHWILERERDTVVVIPEAWKFLPQGRGTPVKLAAEQLIRQGAALRNYIWLDSQDLGGIDKTVLRSVHVWLLGVQREANEIKRTLDNIPAGSLKPKKENIALLQLGQFFACWGDRTVKTYVQPAWMTETEAQAVALGVAAPPPTATAPDPVPTRRRAATPQTQEAPTMCQEHQRLQAELERVTQEARENMEDAQRRVAALEDLVRKRTAESAQSLEAASAAIDLVDALRRLLAPSGGVPPPAAAGSYVVDEDVLVRRVLERIPAGGTAPVTVTPPEKLRKDFQRAEAARIVSAAGELKPLAKRVLKLLEAAEGAHLFQKGIAERLGRATGGGSWIELGVQVKELASLGWVEIDGKKGVRSSLRSKIEADLQLYQPAPGDVDAVYQNVLHTLATEATA